MVMTSVAHSSSLTETM